MKSIGFIPLRKNSKGIPGKNKKKLLGRPLFCWVLGQALASELDTVYIFTDDPDIVDFIAQEYHWTDRVITVEREAHTATDTASTEDAMLSFLKSCNPDYDIFCLLQATSPFTTALDIDQCLQKVKDGTTYDSSLSVVRTHRFTWDDNGKAQNYDIFKRPRRQDFKGLLIENGAIYITKKAALEQSENRLSRRTALVEMPEDSLTEIDSMTDWKIVEELLAARLKKGKGSQRISHLILDVDGVFTDGSVYYGVDGELLKNFDMRDGMGLEILRQHNIEVMVMTSETSEIVASRMKKLKIDKLYMGVKDKYSLLSKLVDENKLSFSQLAYVGDDVNDLANICACGWSFAPANAMIPVKNHADVILSKNSAAGAIREVCDFLLRYNTRYE